jgi:hypothetical protein
LEAIAIHHQENSHVLERRNKDIAETDDLMMSQIGSVNTLGEVPINTYVFVLQMLKQFKFSVCAFRQYGCGEGLHNFLDSDGLSCKLILGGASNVVSMSLIAH